MVSDTVMLVVDGTTLGAICADPNIEREFFEIAKFSKTVCVCRCSPTQKAVVARNIKEVTGKRIACVGDGGNDVAMIQEADVGLGIVGKEGMQAPLAADFSIDKFCHMMQLFLWHGRLSYKRTAMLSQFVCHRGMIISYIQAIFTCIYFFITIPIYNGFLLLGYSTCYTCMPVFSIVLDVDVERKKVMEFPALYQTLQYGRLLNFKTFIIWSWMSILQACIIMLFATLYFENSFLNIVTITFTSLILIEILNVYSMVTNVVWTMLAVTVVTLMMYFGSIIVMRTYIDVATLTGAVILKICILTAVTWGPTHMLNRLIQYLDPSQEDKIMKGAT